mgnify:CR=1 FL=1
MTQKLEQLFDLPPAPSKEIVDALETANQLEAIVPQQPDDAMDKELDELVDKAVGYTEKDKTKKDPVPYVWLARGLYKISLTGSSNPNFKNAYKDAIGAMASAFKNDKDGTKLVDHQEFIADFQGSLAEIIGNEIAAGDLNKAAGWVSKYYKITKNPVGAKFLDAASKYKKGDKHVKKEQVHAGFALGSCGWSIHPRTNFFKGKARKILPSCF